jgi:phenol 2-monooxygenase
VQFHLDGFRVGDPAVSPAARAHPTELPSEVDVLIVGAGPAGLVLGAQLAAFPQITTRIVERAPGPLELGRADGVACRTVEMFHAFGFAERLVKEAYGVNETVFWRPDPTDRHRIVRTGRVQDVADDLSECPHVILNQARVHDYLLEAMRRSPTRLEPDYGLEFVGLEFVGLEIEAGGSHPVRVALTRSGGTEVSVRARYVVGCDGARSAVRRAIGRELHGDAANHAWGVMDVLAVTDFPDIRRKAAIQSAGQGNILIIPREGGYLVRLYVDLGTMGGLVTDRDALRRTSADEVIAIARRVLHPYTLDVRELVWFSVYEVGQRLTDRFDDVPAELADTHDPHVFIAGDACHTHSAKAGQGMNVSMQDAFNLGWKLAAVLHGRSAPSLLRSYSAERQPVAQELIDFDREWSAMMAAPPRDPSDPGAGGVDPAELQDYFVRAGRYTAGVATRYRPGLLTGTAHHQHLAVGLPIGMRFHSAPVIRLADAKPVELGHAALADGRWRLYLFADPSRAALDDLCDRLEGSPASPIRRFVPPSDDVDSVIDTRAVLQQHHRDVEIGALPALLLPRKGQFGLIDYEKVFTAPLPSGDDIYARRGIDRARGAVVVVRPDQYVGHILPLEAFDELAAYFAGFLVEPR